MVRRLFLALSIFSIIGLFLLSCLWPPLLFGYTIIIPVVLLGLHDMYQSKHTLLRIYPVIGHGRYLLESIRPEIQQYFVESNTDGKPFPRERRSVIYQRAKGQKDKVPFGTQLEVNAVGYEWISHSLSPKERVAEAPRVMIGGKECTKPYASSYLNISAMSYGSLSKTAIESLNAGAKRGGFAHNTGEGGISSYHKDPGGDLIYQLGTGYFGSRGVDGSFDSEVFKKQANLDTVKMIEIKLSQGAKPGHGGILPGQKVTAEIASIRGVEIGKTVNSPPGHVEFSTPIGLLKFVKRLRELSAGKPIGFKLCVGRRSEFLGICKAMLQTGILPDFITVDGGEGGTGAAPLELSNAVGMPLRDGLIFVHNALVGTGLRDEIKIIASGKIATGFDMFRGLAMGADLFGSARGMMFSLGCIQARSCHNNACPVGIATQDPKRYKAIDINDKSERVFRYQEESVEALMELIAVSGLDSPTDIHPKHVNRRVSVNEVKRYDSICQWVKPMQLIDGVPPDDWQHVWTMAKAEVFSS